MSGLVLGGAVATPSIAAARGEGNGPGKERPAAPAKPRAVNKATVGPRSADVSKSATDGKPGVGGKPAADGKPGADGKPAAGARPAAGGKTVAGGRPAARGKSVTSMKTVVYQGYEFQVPTNWPVYRLDQNPQTCVRYDVHAVYLGTPGKDMQCSAGLVGQTQTVSFIPGEGPTAGSGAGSAAAPGGAGDTDLQRLPAVHSTVRQNSVQHKLQVTLATAAPGATVLGTYGADPAGVERVLNTLQMAPSGAASTPQSAAVPRQPGGSTERARLSAKGAPLAPQRASARPAAAPAKAAPAKAAPAKAAPAKPAPAKPAQPAPTPTYTSWRGVPGSWPQEVVQPTSPAAPPKPTPPAQPKPPPAPTHPVGGFDTCTAPSTSTMRTWRSNYAAIGVYIGGANAACAYGNLSASWLKTVFGMGWGVLPTYVGAQAPCWGGSGALINPSSAAAQGESAGADAVNQAKRLSLGAGSPIYYDMEAYNGGASCKNAVLQFLGAWDRKVKSAGYSTAVYSSQDSGIVDMQAAAANKASGFTPPDAVWIALWDNNPSLNDGTLTWPLSDRVKQYSGNINQTIGGITLNIDKDLVGGPVAHLLIRVLKHR
jgi:hypothetical protein